MTKNHLHIALLQLFAEGAPSGVTAAVAAPQEMGEAAAAAQEAPDAGVQDLDAEFEDLIKGKFKQAYDSRMQSTIARRLKGTKDIVDRYNALSPVLDILAQRCGVDAADTEGLRRALSGGQPPSAGAQRLADSWRTQAQETQKFYPAFDLGAELQNERFRALLHSRVDVKTAYEVLHAHEIIPAAMAVAARAAEGKLARKIAAGNARPAENGMGAASAAVVRHDVSKLTRSQIDEVSRRVARGERITFG